jgi:pimeloyl-ACP methyl ester carboxylesterase
MPYVTRDSVRTHYVMAGEGPAFVFLHPLPFDHTVYRYQLAHFSTWFRCIAIDFRGFGRSDAVTTKYGLGDLCDDVLAVCAAEDVKEAVLLGTSIGSKAVLQLGLDRPDLFKAVIAVGAGNKPAKDHGRRIEAYRTEGRDGFHPKHLASVVTNEFAASPLGAHLLGTMLERGRALGMTGEAMARSVGAAHDRDLRPRLPSMSVPLLVINGEHDNSRPGGTETAKLVPSARHEILADRGHACCLEDPAGFDALVIDFLTQHAMMPKTASPA